jgi:hypothetical protein
MHTRITSSSSSALQNCRSALRATLRAITSAKARRSLSTILQVPPACRAAFVLADFRQERLGRWSPTVPFGLGAASALSSPERRLCRCCEGLLADYSGSRPKHFPRTTPNKRRLPRGTRGSL